MEARTQLALGGDADSINLLNEDAAALFKRDPKSPAALEAAYAQVNLAYGLAKAAPADDLKWLHEFAKLARHFAVSFPSEDRRSLPLLFAAGLSCELADEPKEALACYSLIRKDFPNSTFAARVTPIIKRLKLAGGPPRIAGPTLAGDTFAIDDLLGKVVLVVFWSSETEPFQEQLPQLQKVIRKQSKRGLEVVGINLDIDDSIVRNYTVDQKIAWPQLFYRDADKRGWAHPIVTHYGVMDIPAYWLIDRNGNVVTTSIKLPKLSAEIDKLLVDGEEKSEN
jgi:peroxiredoxin